MQVHTDSACTLSHECDAADVSTELGDVVVDPAQSEGLILHPSVARDSAVRCGCETCSTRTPIFVQTDEEPLNVISEQRPSKTAVYIFDSLKTQLCTQLFMSLEPACRILLLRYLTHNADPVVESDEDNVLVQQQGRPIHGLVTGEPHESTSVDEHYHWQHLVWCQLHIWKSNMVNETCVLCMVRHKTYRSQPDEVQLVRHNEKCHWCRQC